MKIAVVPRDLAAMIDFMDSIKLKFSLLTLLALVLVVASGINLKTNHDLTRVQQLIWGAIFVAGCLTFIKGVKLIGRH